MDWIVDNAPILYVIFGLAAIGLLFLWYSNRQRTYLGCAAGAVAAIGLFWLLTVFFISDRKQLELNLLAMRDAVLERNTDKLFKHVSKDFQYKLMDRDAMYAAVKALIEKIKVEDIGITNVHFDEVSRAKRFAKISFMVTPYPDRRPFRTEADFVLEGEQWKLKTIRIFGPAGGDEIDVPGLR
jgi:hypothetical protein